MKSRRRYPERPKMTPQLSEFQQRAAGVALERLLTGDYFDITALRKVAELTGTTLQGKDLTALEALHCVHYSKMDRALAVMVREIRAILKEPNVVLGNTQWRLKMSPCPVDYKQCQCSGTKADPCQAVEILRRDAERYRWLRQRHDVLCRMYTARGLGLDLSAVYVRSAEQLDSIIDAAMKESK